MTFDLHTNFYDFHQQATDLEEIQTAITETCYSHAIEITKLKILSKPQKNNPHHRQPLSILHGRYHHLNFILLPSVVSKGYFLYLQKKCHRGLIVDFKSLLQRLQLMATNHTDR